MTGELKVVNKLRIFSRLAAGAAPEVIPEYPTSSGEVLTKPSKFPDKIIKLLRPPPMATSNKQTYEVGDWLLDPAEHLLLHNGEPVALTPKVFVASPMLGDRRAMVPSHP